MAKRLRTTTKARTDARCTGATLGDLRDLVAAFGHIRSDAEVVFLINGPNSLTLSVEEVQR